ncbi:hypothetical protein RHSIM_Rhsim02G0162200 [Rhododendron simsii]|uniref:Uncharacterized protein n=1 Tax=Rhododendron simsii TaxID=118357 RepID=A0A834LSZ9_RHOSS|nr:hypothetical protein RHSIM_Rhsim02G0162200 [Rhododendron simsii]
MEGVAILEEYTGRKKKKLPPLPPHQEAQHRSLTPFLRPVVPPTEDPVICRYRGGQSYEAVNMQTYLCFPKQEPQMKQEVAIDCYEAAKNRATIKQSGPNFDAWRVLLSADDANVLITTKVLLCPCGPPLPPLEEFSAMHLPPSLR